MSKSLEDLNTILFQQVGKLSEASEEGLETEIKRSKSIIGIATSVITNTRLIHDIYESQGGLKSIESRPDILRVKKHSA